MKDATNPEFLIPAAAFFSVAVFYLGFDYFLTKASKAWSEFWSDFDRGKNGGI